MIFSELKRNFGFDLLRAIAISLVLFSHCSYLLFPEGNSLSITVVRTMGAIGVDLFFVLSGYLIGGILLKLITKRKVNFKELLRFWKRRWLRTLPNYFLILIVNIILLLILRISLPENVILYFGFLQNAISSHPKFFTEAWSLSIEEFAYLLLPFAIFMSAVLFKKQNGKHLFIGTTILIIIILTIVKWIYFNSIKVYSYQEWSTTFRKVVVYRMDSIYYGFVAVYLIKAFPRYIKRCKNILFFFGGCLFVLLHFIIYYLDIQPETSLWFYTFVYLQMVIISLAMLFPFFQYLNGFNNIINKIVLFVSTRSYAMYLINYSIVLLNIERIMNRSVLSMTEKWGLVVIFLLITFVVSNLIYKNFERPILIYRDKKFPR